MIRGSALQQFTPRLVVIMRLATLLALVGYTALPGKQASAAVSQPGLLTANSFAVLAGTTVTNTGATVIGPPQGAPVLGGDLGVSPGAAVTNFPPGIVTPPGVMHKADAVALQAQKDATTAYNTLAGETPCTALPASIGTLTLTPGVYCFTSAALFTTPSSGLTLNLQGNSNALFIFKIPSQLTTQSGYAVSVINGSAPCNVWWQVGSSATLGTSTSFVGNILALTSISMATGASLSPGRALARNGAVTLDTNRVNMAGCTSVSPTSTPTSTATQRPPPPPPPPGPTSTLNALPTPSSPTTPTSPNSVNSPFAARLPLTGYPPADVPDNRLPLTAAGGVFLLAAGVWVIKRRR